MSGIFHRMREMYRKEGGAFPDPILNLTWNYTDPTEPDPEELAKDMNGRALVDIKDDDGRGHAACRPVAGRLRPVARRRHDLVRLLDLLGLLHRERQPDGPARRDRPARAGHRAELGLGVAGQPADPLQPRQRRPRGQSLEPSKSRSSSGTAAKWTGIDVPDYAPTTKPSDGVGPFIMNAEGVGRLFARDQMAEGPFPEHYEPFESPVAERAASEGPSRTRSARVFADDRAAFGDRAGLPLCRDHLPADRAFPLLDQARADQRDPAAGGIHRDRRSAGEGEGHRAGRLGARLPRSAASSSARPM